MQGPENRATELDAYVPFEGFEGRCSPQREKQQCVHKLAATNFVQVRSVRLLCSAADTQRVEGKMAKMFRIVVFAGNKGVEATS